MGILSDAKNLYVVSDRVAIKDYTRDCVNYWMSRGIVPMLEQVAEDLFDSDEFTLYSYSESKELVSDDQLEMISVYDFAKNVQNLVSFMFLCVSVTCSIPCTYYAHLMCQ